MGLFRKSDDVLVCPKCGSTENEKIGSMKTDHVPGTMFTGKPLTPALYRCAECGYEGPLVLIEKSELEEFKKELSDR